MYEAMGVLNLSTSITGTVVARAEFWSMFFPVVSAVVVGVALARILWPRKGKGGKR